MIDELQAYYCLLLRFTTAVLSVICCYLNMEIKLQ